MHKWFLFFFFVILSSCSDKVAGRGGVDETSNGIHAYVTDENGNGVASAMVILRPVNYLAQNSMALQNLDLGIYNGTTDEYGHFHIDTLVPGEYILEVRAPELGTLTKLVVEKATLQDVLADTISLQKYASLTGKVDLAPDMPYARVAILGMDRVVHTDKEGNFSIDGVPSGDIITVVLAATEDKILGELALNINPSEELSIGGFISSPSSLDEWKYSADIAINTQDLTKDLQNYSFPIHFRGGDFPVGSSLTGADLRLYDAKEQAVEFAVTHWSPSTREGTIWVRLDKIKASDAINLKLYWGRPGTLSLSTPENVFDTAQWAAVVPLQNSFVDAEGDLRTPVYATGSVPGLVIGTDGFPPEFSASGTWFDGLEQGVGIHGFPLDFGRENYTVQIWLRPELEGGIWLSRDNKAGGNWNHSERAFYLGGDFSINANRGLQPTQITHGSPYNTYARAKDSVALHEWVHLALRCTTWNEDTLQAQWYINGQAVKTNNDLVLSEPDKMRDTLYIATEMFERSFLGDIYQLQIAKKALDPARIAFDALIQRPNNPLISVKF
ncbi:MAG: DUF2341 domain-containing protein [Fibrobacter sp.]|nr:DUF2341 domain-containing protein [Fibrobacter sp.]